MSLTYADNVPNWDRAVLIAILIVGYDINFAWSIQANNHERAFIEVTTITFPYLVQRL